MAAGIVGPIAGATELTMDTGPVVFPRRTSGTSVISVVIGRGIR